MERYLRLALSLLVAALLLSVGRADGQVCSDALICISKSVTDPGPYDPIGPACGVLASCEDVGGILDVWRVPGNTPVGSEDGRRAWKELSLERGFPGGDETPTVDLGDQVIDGAGQIDLGPYLQDVEPVDWFEEAGVIGAESCSSKACHWLETPTIPPLNYPQLTLSDYELLSDVELHVALLLNSDPVDPSSGEFVLQATDLAFPGFGIGFAHTRIYRSGLFYDGPMGFAWDHGYNRRLLEVESETCGADVLYTTGQGSTLLFRPVSSSSESAGSQVTTVTTRYEPAPGIPLVLERVERSTIGIAALVRVSLHWEMSSPDGTRGRFDERGLLTQLRDPNQSGLDIAWEGSSEPEDSFRVDLVVDSVGREIDYEYDDAGRLHRVSEPETGLFAEYSYDANGDLVTATDSTGRTESYLYSSGFPDEVGGYAPEGFLRSSCELACAPSYSSCDAGGGCDDAPKVGRQACVGGCFDCVFKGCAPACMDYCRPGGEGRELCQDACGDSCGEYCTEAKIDELCQSAWKAGVDDYCDDCLDRVQDACGFNCASIAHCFAKITNDDAYWASVGACLTSFGLGGIADGVVDGLATLFTGTVDVLQCIGKGVCKAIPKVSCGNCDFNPSEKNLAKFCNNVCVECVALGKIEECADPPPTCLADGVSCKDECRQEFFGLANDRNTCEVAPAGAFGCPAKLAQECPDVCAESCVGTCAGSCVVDCREGCVDACDVPGCTADCESVPDEEWVDQCEPSCVEGCIEAEHQKGAYIGPKYGHPRDLNHNLLRVFDGNGALYIENTYGETLWEPSYDSVVRQLVGEETTEFHYRDLENEVRITTTPGESSRFDLSAEELLLVDVSIHGRPQRWPRPDAVAAEFADDADEFVSVDICPGPCTPPGPSFPGIFFPAQDALLALATEPDDPGADGLDVILAEDAHLRPTAFSFQREDGGVLLAIPAAPPLRASPDRFTLRIEGTAVEFEHLDQGRYFVDARALADSLAGRELFVAETPAGRTQAHLGRVAALHHVAAGRCHRPFAVSHEEDGALMMSPPGACTAELTLSPLATRVGGPASTEGEPDRFEPSPLVPGRHTVHLRSESKAAGYRVHEAADGGAAPESLPISAARLLDFAAGLGLARDGTRPDADAVYVFHLPENRRRALLGGADPVDDSTLATARIVPSGVHLPDLVIVDKADRFAPPDRPQCLGGFFDRPLRGRGPSAPGPRPKRATITVDAFGVAWTQYFDRFGRLLRIENHGTGSERNLNYDELGRLSGVETPLGARTCATHDDVGNLTRAVEYPQPGALGDDAFRTWRFSYTNDPVRPDRAFDPSAPGVALEDRDYDANGNLVALRSPTGEVTLFENEEHGRPVKITAPDGTETHYAYDPDSSRPMEITADATGTSPLTVSQSFDRAGRLLRSENALGAVTEWAWAGGLLERQTRIADDNELRMDFTWDADSQLARVIMPERRLELDYALSGTRRQARLVPEDDSLLRAVECDLFVGRRLVERVHADGTRQRFSYDPEGRIQTVEAGSFSESPDDWDDDCPVPPTAADTAFVVAEFQNDLEGRPVRITDSSDGTVHFSYDGFSRLVRTTDAEGTTFRAGFDRADRQRWAAVYGPPGVSVPHRPPELSDPGLLSAELFDYDAAGRLVERRALHFDEDQVPVGDGEATTHIAYDTVVGEVSITDDAGSTTVYGADGARRLVRVDLPTGDTIEREFLDGNRTVITRRSAPTPSGEIVERYRLTQLGDALTHELVMDGSNALLRSWLYDVQGRLSGDEDASGRSRSIDYDAFGGIVGLNSGFGDASEHVRLTRDAMGRVVRRESTAPDLLVTEYAFDVLGRVLRIERPEGLAETFTYDGASPRVLTRTLGDGTVLEYDYSPNGLPTGLTARGQTEEFSFDPAGRLVSARTTGPDPGDLADDVEVQFAWDSLDNRTRENRIGLGASVTVEHTYTGRGLPISSAIDGVSVARAFDSASRLKTLTVNGPASASLDFEYSGIGRPTKIVRTSGVETEFSYDPQGEPSGQTELFGSEVLARWRWERPLVSQSPRLSALFVPDRGERASIFSIGPGERLLAENHNLTGLEGIQIDPGASMADAESAVSPFLTTGASLRRYELDGRHNWLRLESGDPVFVVEPKRNGLDGYVSFGEEILEYDERGALATRDGANFTRDGFGRLVGVEDDGAERLYRYDALGRLVAVIDPTTEAVTSWAYDGLQRIAQVQPDGTMDVTLQAEGLDEHILTVSSDGELQFLHSDRQGSVFLVTDKAGAPLEWQEFTAYGETRLRGPTGEPLSNSAIGNRFGFQGQPFDPDTGLYEMRARFYDPEIGRFLRPDPLGHMGSPNLYSFVDAAPLAWNDPLGLEKTGNSAALAAISGARPNDPVRHQLPPIDYGWMHQEEGFLYSAYSEAAAVANNSNNSLGQRVASFGLALLTAPVAWTEEYIARPILNVPNSASIAGQLFARGSLQTDTLNKIDDYSRAIGFAAEGFTAAGSVFEPFVVQSPRPRGTWVGPGAVQRRSRHVGAGRSPNGGGPQPINPSNRRDNCVAGVCAVVKRSDTRLSDITADVIEREFGSVARSRRLSIGDSVSYMQRATGRRLTPRPVGLKEPGHYAIFIGNEHVIYGRIHERTGKIFLLDPQTNQRLVIDQLPSFAKGQPVRPYRFE